jgi:aspartyl-tRNA(Asn)/glutamyl-tRNA(Gln) amidotransferase subunit A
VNPARTLLEAALSGYGVVAPPEDLERAAHQLTAVLRRLEPLEGVRAEEAPKDLDWPDARTGGRQALHAGSRPRTASSRGPSTDDVLRLSLVEVARAIRRKHLSPVEVTEAALRRIEEVNPRLGAFLWVDADRALMRARRAEEDASHGRFWGPLHGVPMALKDLIAEEGAPWTCGSPLRRDVVAERDAAVTARLRLSGALFVGRTHLHEWAYGVSNDNPHFGPARNPWDPSRSPGGSSGGSGVALATGCIYGSVGTDTGGSIRIPAALCGVVGLKPTYGLLPTDGVFPLSWSLDHVGPMARTVEDVALLLGILVGRPFRISPDVRGLRVGVLRGDLWSVVHPDVARVVDGAIQEIGELGVEVTEFSLEGATASAVATALLMVEASTVHLPSLRTHLRDYGRDVRERLLVGLALAGERYVRARQVRRALARRIVEEVFGRVDVLLTPTVPVPAPILGEETTDVSGKPYDTRSLLTRFTNPMNALGLPSLSVPCGLVEGLPVGLQVIGRPLEEATVLRVGMAYERARGPFPLP